MCIAEVADVHLDVDARRRIVDAHRRSDVFIELFAFFGVAVMHRRVWRCTSTASAMHVGIGDATASWATCIDGSAMHVVDSPMHVDKSPTRSQLGDARRPYRRCTSPVARGLRSK
jgi:hypothetical protein